MVIRAKESSGIGVWIIKQGKPSIPLKLLVKCKGFKRAIEKGDYESVATSRLIAVAETIVHLANRPLVSFPRKRDQPGS